MMAHYEYIAKKYLKPLSPLTGLSLGCGTGEREFCWSEQCQFRQLRAIDISRDRIDAAKSEAQRRGFSHLAFEVADVQAIALPESHYDVVFGEHSLHHFKQLAHLFASISRTLKPNGYFVVNEYVGPSRFQWTDRQLEAINGALELLPHQYRKRWSDGSVKRKVWRPSLLHMWWTDPSEAAESGAIRDELHKRFEVIEIREYGGGILHMLLAGIAMNFQSEDEETIHLTRLLFEIEDTLMKRGDIESDFMLAVARRRDS